MRFFALPVFATVLSFVGLRMMNSSAPAEAGSVFVVSVPSQDSPVQGPEIGPIVTPEKIWGPPEQPTPAPVTKPEPMIIVLDPLPTPLPPGRVDVVEWPVPAPQTTVINAPVTHVYTVVQPATEPRQEVLETPVVVFICPIHHRPGCCPPAPPRRPAPQQDNFFRTIPFQPLTPKGPRFNP